MSAAELDTVRAVETPEGVRLELSPAGLPVRLLAYGVDIVIRSAVFVAIVRAVNPLGGIGVAVWLIAAFALEWFYPVIFEISASGGTPGKRLFGLSVVMDDGLPVTLAASMTRNLLRIADFLPFAYGTGIVSLLCRADFKRLGDLGAGTLVVHRPPGAQIPVLPATAPRPPAMDLEPRTQAAIVSFAARAPQLTSERADELARLASLAIGLRLGAGGDATARLCGIAQWLLGRR